MAERLSELEQMVSERTQDLQKANQSLTLSEERFSKAFHESPLASGIQRMSDQRFIDVNQSLARIAGFNREDLIGRSPAEIFLWQQPEVADQWIESLLRGETVRDQAVNIRTQPPLFANCLCSAGNKSCNSGIWILTIRRPKTKMLCARWS